MMVDYVIIKSFKHYSLKCPFRNYRYVFKAMHHQLMILTLLSFSENLARYVLTVASSVTNLPLFEQMVFVFLVHSQPDFVQVQG